MFEDCRERAGLGISSPIYWLLKLLVSSDGALHGEETEYDQEHLGTSTYNCSKHMRQCQIRVHYMVRKQSMIRSTWEPDCSTYEAVSDQGTLHGEEKEESRQDQEHRSAFHLS